MSALQLLPCELYHPEMFTCWHDGPVIILDSQCIFIERLGSAKYVACHNEQQIADFIQTMYRPTAACVYAIMTIRGFYDLWLQEDIHKGIDVRLVVQ